MHDIFISYSHKDREQVARLATVLETCGYKVWWDRELLASQDYAQKIEDALNTSQCILTVWSPNSVASKWVRAESNRGFTQDKLVPVLIEAANIPIPFDSVHSADLRHWNGEVDNGEFPELLKALDWRLNTKNHQQTVSTHTQSPSLTNQPQTPTGKSGFGWALGFGLLAAVATTTYLILPSQSVPTDAATQKQALSAQVSTDAAEALENCKKNNEKAEDPDARQSIVKAAVRNNIKRVQQCIDLGVDVNLKTENKDEWTPLHAAASRGHLDVLKLLAGNGGDIHAKSKAQQSVLHVAVIHNRYHVVSYLKDSGAKTNEPDAKGNFPCARAKGQMKVLLAC